MKIQVDYREFTVEAMPAHETRVDGLFLNYEHKILVDASLCPAEQASVLLHELIHAIWTVRGFPARLTEEQVCTMLAPALATVLKDNRDLWDRLGKGLWAGTPVV